MIFTEVTLSYPCVRYRVEVSHFTARKSTAIEWVILEALNKCEKLPNYAGIHIAPFFEQIFTISDADLLIRPVLFSLQDIGAITITGIDDETKLDTVAMSNLKLTKLGQEMQSRGLLPGTVSEDSFYVYYDVAANDLKYEANLYKQESTGIRIMKIDDANDVDFPESAIREWLFTIQNDEKRKRFNWLTPTTRIESVTPLSFEIHWKNIIRKVEIVERMKWIVNGVEDENIDEITLKEADISIHEELMDLPYLEIADPDKEIKKLISLDGLNTLICDYLQKDDMFCVDSKYYKDVKIKQQNNKRNRIGFIYGVDSFDVKKTKKQIIIRIPDRELKKHGVYFNSDDTVKTCITSVNAGSISKKIAIAYIPNINEISFIDMIVELVDKYYTQDSVILFALYELGLKKLFLEYVNRIVLMKQKLSDRAKIIELFNEQGREYYGINVILAADKEKMLVNEADIIERCRTIKDATEVITEYTEINIFRQNESLLQRILRIVIEHVGEQNSSMDIFDFWKAITSSKKAYINWITKSGLYRYLYSKRSILELIDRFTDDNLFEIEEYTAVEQIILDMKRIALQVETLMPELNLYKTVSQEKCNELLLAHMDSIDVLYDQVRKWQDEEELFSDKVMDLSEALRQDSPFTNVKKNMDGLRYALSTFYDDSFMRFNKVYIVDTCTLMNEPALISWFDGEKALLVVPMVVLNELDGLKNSEDEEIAYRARDTIRNISNYKAYDWLNIGESSHPELLSDDLDKERNDYKILSIAIKYCIKKPVLLTDDINLGNIATANKIENMTLESYQIMKQHEKIVNKKCSTKKPKKKKRR